MEEVWNHPVDSYSLWLMENNGIKPYNIKKLESSFQAFFTHSTFHFLGFSREEY
ncbi:hypothetical protein KJK41_01605 [Bacillus haikouensis]|nr:hypothetical protein KJK41_01605 [Bacillus haikouensis]